MRLKIQLNTEPGRIEVPGRSCRLPQSELRDDLGLEGTFEDAIKVLVQPVRVRKFMPAKHTTLGRCHFPM